MQNLFQNLHFDLKISDKFCIKCKSRISLASVRGFPSKSSIQLRKFEFIMETKIVFILLVFLPVFGKSFEEDVVPDDSLRNILISGGDCDEPRQNSF
jgi:hypothetical protein